MMYNPYQYNPYNAPRQEILRVNGENGAKSLVLPPNSSVLALDENNPIVWFCQTDGAGYKTTTPYTITPIQPNKPIDYKELESRINKLEELINAKSHPITNESAPTNK